MIVKVKSVAVAQGWLPTATPLRNATILAPPLLHYILHPFLISLILSTLHLHSLSLSLSLSPLFMAHHAIYRCAAV